MRIKKKGVEVEESGRKSENNGTAPVLSTVTISFRFENKMSGVRCKGKVAPKFEGPGKDLA